MIAALFDRPPLFSRGDADESALGAPNRLGLLTPWLPGRQNAQARLPAAD
jgi:hypothetical protein